MLNQHYIGPNLTFSVRAVPGVENWLQTHIIHRLLNISFFNCIALKKEMIFPCIFKSDLLFAVVFLLLKIILKKPNSLEYTKVPVMKWKSLSSKNVMQYKSLVTCDLLNCLLCCSSKEHSRTAATRRVWSSRKQWAICRHKKLQQATDMLITGSKSQLCWFYSHRFWQQFSVQTFICLFDGWLY